MIKYKKNKSKKNALNLALVTGLGLALHGLPALAQTSPYVHQELEAQRELIQELLDKQEARERSLKDRSTVSFYGIIDTGVEYLTNVHDGDGGDKGLTRIPSATGTVPSRFGVDAHIEFAEGYKGLAKLEGGFSPDDAKLRQGGRVFGRQLYMGLQTPYGRLTAGRQYSQLLYAEGVSDLMGPNIYGVGSVDAYLPNSRWDNSLAWSHQLTDRISAGVTYSFGRDTGGGGAPGSGECRGEESQLDSSSACRAWSAMLKYDTGIFGLAGGIDNQNGGDGARANFFNGQGLVDMSDSSDTDRRINLGGYVKLDDVTIGAGWLGREVDTSETNIQSDTYYLTGRYAVTSKFTLDGGGYRTTNDDQDADATMLVMRGMYNITSGLDGYVQVGHMINSDNAAYMVSAGGGDVSPPRGKNQTGTMVGLRYMF